MAPASTTGAQALAGSAQDGVVYVSLTAGSVAGGASATIQRVGDYRHAITSVIDGGFVPVAVPARISDSIEIVIRDLHGAILERQRISVAATRAPVVVRTYPPPRKRDHPLNAAIVVAFSEPMSAASITPGAVRLVQGASTVSGTVQFLDATLDASHASLQFIPDAPLAAHTDYQLLVSSEVRDLSNDHLATPDTVAFTTSDSLAGLPASIHTSPDSELFLRAGDTYQLTAIVRDSAGNVLTDQPVTWSTGTPCAGNPDVFTVSATGLVTALADGSGAVLVRIGDLKKCVLIFITPEPAASITITPNPATVAASDTIQLLAIARDSAGRVINNPSPGLEWTSSAPALAILTPYCAAPPFYGCVSGYETITAVSPGSVTITVTSGTTRGTATVTVGPARPVASVTLAPDPATLVITGFAKLLATLRDANDRIVSRRKVTWTSDNAAVATVDTSGLVRGVSLGSAKVIATAEGFSDTAAITVTTISVSSLDAGGAHTCALTGSGAAYCWGSNEAGQLGLGTGKGQGPEDCDRSIYRLDCSTVPVAVFGGLTFASLSAGSVHTCGLTTSGAAYCWGWGLGQLYNSNDSVPAAVSGGLTFSSLSAGGAGTCGLTTSGAAYCWGRPYGPYGSNVPLAVTGGLTFASLSAGQVHTCGLTTDGTAYCWGSNDDGQFGDGSTTSSLVPVAVTGGLTFALLSAGADGIHTCGLTTGGAAYCWGFNTSGQLGGDSTNYWSLVPVAVSGGLTFASLSAGGAHTCGLTTAGAAYCWGSAIPGNESHVPVAVSGGFTFASLSAGKGYTCGVTISGTAYCWGSNGAGSLGNGTLTNSPVPVKVAGQP